jgi:hypothetical protein
MPRKLNINREAVRCLALVVGVREAARQMHLPRETVQAWSTRYNWFKSPLAPSAPISPSDALARSIRQMGGTTKFHLAKSTDKASRRMSKKHANDIIENSDKLTHLVNAASKIHGWEAEQKQEGSLTLSLLSGRGGRTRIAIETESEQSAEDYKSTVLPKELLPS